MEQRELVVPQRPDFYIISKASDIIFNNKQISGEIPWLKLNVFIYSKFYKSFWYLGKVKWDRVPLLEMTSIGIGMFGLEKIHPKANSIVFIERTNPKNSLWMSDWFGENIIANVYVDCTKYTQRWRLVWIVNLNRCLYHQNWFFHAFSCKILRLRLSGKIIVNYPPE